MAATRKYVNGGKTVSLYLPTDLIVRYDALAAERGMSRNALIIRDLENVDRAGEEDEVSVVTEGDTVPSSPGAPRPCSHNRTVNLGYLTRCKDCGAEV